MLPAVNATLNATSALLIALGYYFIVWRRDFVMHKRLMLGACATSAVFLACYLVYHYFAGATRFTATGWPRVLYFTILISHTILAVAVLPLVILSVWNGLKDRRKQHRRVSKWTFPVWMYVSVTGVLVYFFLYHWFPGERM